MSEEQIIEILTKIVEDEQAFYNTDIIIQRNAIGCLLDLYNKEKEKNKELQNYMKEYLIPKSTINLVYISKDKIKAKIEEIDIEIQCCEYADDDTEEYKQDIEKEKRRLLRDKAVLQSLLEKE